MAEYDLTHELGKYLDLHLYFHLLEHVEKLEIYKPDDINKAKFEVLRKTKMIDFTKTAYLALSPAANDPFLAELSEKRAKIVETLKSWGKELQPLLDILNDNKLVEDLRDKQNFDFHFLKKNYNITEQHVSLLFQYAKLKYDIGFYADASFLLSDYRALSQEDDKIVHALWGKLAAEILLANWDDALLDMNRLRQAVEDKVNQSQLVRLQQRTWLIHWSLFIFFSYKDPLEGINLLVDFLSKEEYLNTIQTTCPHILRYLTVAVLIARRQPIVLQDLAVVIEQEQYTYSDPITDFLKALYVDFDFELAQQKLKDCRTVFDNDFFLKQHTDLFFESARTFYFETFFKVHKCVDLRSLSTRLEMDEEQAEQWIVNLVRQARLPAKIDSEAHTITMATEFPSIYQQMIDRTENVAGRTTQLINNIDKKYLSRDL